jgi:hypothetical protein
MIEGEIHAAAQRIGTRQHTQRQSARCAIGRQAQGLDYRARYANAMGSAAGGRRDAPVPLATRTEDSR